MLESALLFIKEMRKNSYISKYDENDTFPKFGQN